MSQEFSCLISGACEEEVLGRSKNQDGFRCFSVALERLLILGYDFIIVNWHYVIGSFIYIKIFG